MRTDLFLNLHYILAAAWRRRYTLVLPIFVVPIIALIVGSLAPKKFSSHTTILIQETSKLNPFLADLAVSTQLKERMAALQALLHSRHMLGEVAEELGYITNTKQPYDSGVLSKLSNALRVELIGSDMIKIHLNDKSPHHMKQTLEVVSKHFLSKLLAPERSSIDASESFLESQLEKQQQALATAEQALAEFKSRFSSNLPGQHRFDIEQLRELEKQLYQKTTDLAGAEAALQSLTTQLLKTNPLLAQVEQQIVTATSQINQLRSRYTERHSKVIRARHALERLEKERRDLMATASSIQPQEFDQLWQLANQFLPGSQKDSLDDDDSSPGKSRLLLISQLEAVELAKSRQQQLQKEISQLEEAKTVLQERVNTFASVEQRLKELERDIETKQRLYNDFLKRFEMAKITGALGRFEEHDRVKVIDRPFTPTRSTNLPVPVYGIAGLFGGIVLGICLALLAEVLDTSVIRRDAIERLTGVPVLSRLPNFSNVRYMCSSTLD